VKYSANGFVPQSQGRYSRRVSSPIDSMSEAELKGKILTSAIEHASLENLDVALQKNLRKGASLLEPRWRRYHPASGRIRHLIQTLFRSYTSLSLSTTSCSIQLPFQENLSEGSVLFIE
jgi:hypothetical protein